MGGLIDMERKGCESIGCYTHFVTQFWPQPWPWPWIFKVKFWKSHISGMGWPIDMESKGCESIGCWTNIVTFNFPLTHDLDRGFSRSNFLKSFILWMGWLIDMETKGIWVDRMLDPCCDFQCSPLSWPWLWIFKVKFWKSRISGMGWPIDMEWKGCESIECYSHCDFKLWPHPWNCCNSGMGGSTHLEWKGCELDMMLDAQWDWPWATVHGK